MYGHIGYTIISNLNTLKSRKLTDLGLQINIDCWLKFGGQTLNMRGAAGPIWRCQGMQRVLNKIKGRQRLSLPTTDTLISSDLRNLKRCSSFEMLGVPEETLASPG